MRPRRIDHAFFSSGEEQRGEASALAPCIRSPAGSEWLYLPDHSVVTFDLALGLAPTRGIREAGGLSWLTCRRQTIEKQWGLVWLVPSGIEPVQAGRADHGAGGLEPVDDAHSLLYCYTCLRAREVKIVE